MQMKLFSMKQNGALCDVRLICPRGGANSESGVGGCVGGGVGSGVSSGVSGGVSSGVGVEILAHKSVLASGCAFFYAQFTSAFSVSSEEQNSSPLSPTESLIMDERVIHNPIYDI